MGNNFEIQQKKFVEGEDLHTYNDELLKFISDHTLPNIEDSEVSKFTFKEREENLDCIRQLEDPRYLNSFFESRGYYTSKAKPIINQNSTTLFVSAGVQVLDSVVFDEKKFPEKNIFVCQPVFRTQYIDQVGEGYSTTFINTATEILNPTPAEHFNALEDWFEVFEKLGMSTSKISIKTRSKEPQWGNKKFKESILMIYYDGLEIGDANYIYQMEQKSRAPLKISDIGFGLERIIWTLKGGTYLSSEVNQNVAVSEYSKAMMLLAGSGLRPGNKEHGYRLRQISKRLVKTKKKFEELVPILKYYYNHWKKWTYLAMPESGAIEAMRLEYERNAKNLLE